MPRIFWRWPTCFAWAARGSRRRTNSAPATGPASSCWHARQAACGPSEAGRRGLLVADRSTRTARGAARAKLPESIEQGFALAPVLREAVLPVALERGNFPPLYLFVGDPGHSRPEMRQRAITLRIQFALAFREPANTLHYLGGAAPRHGVV